MTDLQTYGHSALQALNATFSKEQAETMLALLASVEGGQGTPGPAGGVEFGVHIARDEGIVTGGYPATRSAWGSMTMSRFFAEAMGGDATVAVRVNDDLVHGPIVVAEDERITQPIEIELSEGDTVTFDVVGDGATRLWAQIDRGAA